MIGSKQIVIDASEFLKGMSSGSEISDGGLSTETEAVNLIAQPGVLYAPAAEVNGDSDTILSDEIIASVPDHNVSDIDSRLCVAENGTFYKYNGTKLQHPNEASAEDSSNTFAKGFTDAINFAGASFFTSKEKITKWSAASTFDHDYTTSAFAFTSYPHPAVVFENNAYYGDGNTLLRQTTVTDTPTTILTLSSDQVIISLGIDPGSGKMLISTTQTLNVNNTLASINRVHWYDGFSNKTIKSIVVAGMVTALHSHGGNVFVGYDGNNIGLLSGSGIHFVRKLNNASNTDVDEMITKHSFASIGRTMYIVDGAKILAYGPVFNGNSIWYYCAANKFSSPNKFKCIANVGSNKLGMSAVSSKFYTIDVTSKATIDALDLYTNWYNFARPGYIRSIYVQFAEADNTNNWTFTYFDQSSASLINTLQRMEGNITPVLEADYFVNFADSSDSAGNTGEGHQAVRAFKLRVQTSTGNKGIKKIIIYYDPAE